MILTEIKEYDSNIQMSIGQRIQETRIKKGFSGVEISEYLGIQKNQMSRIETGNANCTISQLYVLSQLLDCSVDYLMFGKQLSSKYSDEQEKCIKALVASFLKDSL